MSTRIPSAFAASGDTTTIPDESTSDEVSFDLGWSSAYSKDSTEAGYRYIDRQQHNYLFNVITANLREWQNQSFPAWISDDGDSTPYSYSKYAIVMHTDGLLYVSNSDSNTGTPGTDTTWN